MLAETFTCVRGKNPRGLWQYFLHVLWNMLSTSQRNTYRMTPKAHFDVQLIFRSLSQALEAFNGELFTIMKCAASHCLKLEDVREDLQKIHPQGPWSSYSLKVVQVLQV